MRRARRTFALRAALAVVAVLAIPATAGAPAAPPVAVTNAATTAATRPSDATLTGVLRTAADASRRDSGRETLYSRPSYLSAASRITYAIAHAQPIPKVPDGAPVAQIGGASYPEYFETQVRGAINAVVNASHTVLAYPLHTDAGWSVQSAPVGDGRIRWGVALVVGWPDPATPTNSGCASNGYCWSTRGLNPHLPWTRNTVTWYLSTANLPSNGEALMKSAVATLNRVSGFGADIVYGGLTSATQPNGTNRFLVVWGSGCSSASALACTFTGTQGSYNLIYQARAIISRARYNANPSTSLWVGTLIHEMAHGTGLGHYDRTYLGRYQLMRWAGGPNTIEAGDANGLRRIAPAGRVSASIRAVRAFGGFNLVVHAGNAGLGGIRSIVTQCTDASGAWQQIGTVSGKLDGKPVDRTVGSYVALVGSSRSCRAIVKSKTATVTSAVITVTA